MVASAIVTQFLVPFDALFNAMLLKGDEDPTETMASPLSFESFKKAVKRGDLDDASQAYLGIVQYLATYREKTRQKIEEQCGFGLRRFQSAEDVKQTLQNALAVLTQIQRPDEVSEVGVDGPETYYGKTIFTPAEFDELVTPKIRMAVADVGAILVTEAEVDDPNFDINYAMQNQWALTYTRAPVNQCTLDDGTILYVTLLAKGLHICKKEYVKVPIDPSTQSPSPPVAPQRRTLAIRGVAVPADERTTEPGLPMFPATQAKPAEEPKEKPKEPPTRWDLLEFE